jgi:hypothetical protein
VILGDGSGIGGSATETGVNFAETITGSNERKGSEMPAEGKRMRGTPAKLFIALNQTVYNSALISFSVFIILGLGVWRDSVSSR